MTSWPRDLAAVVLSFACFSPSPLSGQVRRQVTTSPARLVAAFVRDNEGQGRTQSLESIELPAILLSRADYPASSMSALLDSLEAVALSRRPTRVRAIATMALASPGSRDALQPRAGTVARLERIYQRTDSPEVRAAVVSGLTRSTEHQQALGFLETAAIKQPPDFPGEPVAALAAIAGHGERGREVLGRLAQNGRVHDPEAQQWLSLFLSQGH